MRRSSLLAAVLTALAAPATAAGQEATGFRSVLAQGQGTTATATDLAANQATGAVPPEFVNQHELYAGLAVAWPGLTGDALDRFFKTTDFGTLPGGEARTDMPRAGVTIVRDARFAVPRVTGATRDDVMFGAGYAQAQDRLFLMDVLRRTARASTAELLGPGAAESDAQQLTQQDFSADELTAQFESLDERHGPEGARVQEDLRQFVAGINRRIDEVRNDPSQLPAEYPALGASPAPWTIADTAALATFLVSQFNVAGIGERQNSQILSALEERLGARRARRVFDDLRRLDDPEAPTTADRVFRDHRAGRPLPAASARLDPDSIRPRDALVRAPAAGDEQRAMPAWARRMVGLGRRLPATKSNAVLVSGRFSQSGRPLMSAGPQVGYFSPQIFSEIEMHGGGIDVSGVVFPGAAPYVLIGHGKNFAWSGTSPMSDLADTFVERLCDPRGRPIEDPAKATHHFHKGRCVPLTFREQVLRTPYGPTDPTTAPEEIRLRAARSVHGPITHYAEVDGAPVALAQQKTVDFIELDASLAFARLNANQLTDANDFQQVWRDYPGGENWFYVSPTEIAWQLSGFMPVRARGTDPDLPTWGTGEWDWRGKLPFRRNPRSREPRSGHIISWNNKEARGWRAPSEVWELGPTHRSLLLQRRLRAELRRAGGKIDLAGLVRTTEAAALADLEGQELLPLLRRLIGTPPDAETRQLLELLEGWRSRGAEHRDFDEDGRYEDGPAIRLMRGWVPLLARRVFQPVVGTEAVDLLEELGRLDLEPGRSEFAGYHGQLVKDLRRVLRRPQRGRLSRPYCGRGRRPACREIALNALRDAAAELRRTTGGGPDAWQLEVEQQSIVTAGAIPTPAFPLQNRGTFHQVVELSPKAG